MTLQGMNLHLDPFYLYVLATIGATASILQHAMCVVEFPLHAFFLLAMIGISVSFIQYFNCISLNLDFRFTEMNS